MQISKPVIVGSTVVGLIGIGFLVWTMQSHEPYSEYSLPKIEVEAGVGTEDEFFTEFGPKWKVMRGPRRAITGIKGGRIVLQDVSEEGVRSLVHRLLPLYGVAPANLGPAIHEGKPGAMQTFTFPQMKDGYRVLDRGITVVLGPDESVREFRGEMLPLQGGLSPQKFGRDAALKKAKEALSLKFVQPEGAEARVYPTANGSPDLVWAGTSEYQNQKVRVIVSATSGKVLETAPLSSK